MLRLALCSGLALGVSCGAMGADFALTHPVPLTPETAAAVAGSLALSTDESRDVPTVEAAPSPVPAQAAPATPEPRSAVAQISAPPARDPTLISVPSNTIGPGTPLWVRREQEQADARIAQANADEAEANAALARIEAQRAADDPYFFSNYGNYGNYGGGVVVYGPHRPGLDRAIQNRPAPPRHRVDRGDRRGAMVGQPLDEDPFDAAQRQFYDTARPRTGAIVEPQLEAQRRFGNNAYPTKIIGIQNGIDRAVINARRGAPKPQDASTKR